MIRRRSIEPPENTGVLVPLDGASEEELALRLWFNLTTNEKYQMPPGIFQSILHIKYRDLFYLDGSRKLAGFERSTKPGVQAILTKIRDTIRLVWTFDFPVPKSVFAIVLQTIDVAQKLPPHLRNRSANLYALIDDFVILENETILNKRPAPRYYAMDEYRAEDFFNELCLLMNQNTLRIDTVLQMCEASRLQVLSSFWNRQVLVDFIEKRVPDFCVKDEFLRLRKDLEATVTEDCSIQGSDQTPSLPVVEPSPPEVAVKSIFSDPVELFMFYSARLKTTIQLSEYGEAVDIPIDTMIGILSKNRYFETHFREQCENFIRGFEDFERDIGMLRCQPPFRILTFDPLKFLVIVEDICRRVRCCLQLETPTTASTYQIPSIPEYPYKKKLKFRKDEDLENKFWIPAEALETIVSSFEDCDAIRQLFPATCLLRDLPILSHLTSSPIFVVDGCLILH